MKKRRRLSAKERKKEIIEAAIKVFNKKGYKNCTMSDLIKASGLSFGGFYYYYGSKEEILYDIMIEGNNYRIREDDKFIQNHPNLDPTDMFSKLLLNKLLDKNDMTPIYVMLMEETQHNEELRKLYDKLIKNTITPLEEHFAEHNLNINSAWKSELVIGVINSLFLGKYLLNLHDVFEKNSDKILKILRLILDFDAADK
ncbi:MAG: TetR/AcrR family transcriptional regulator [Treponemataceae bacterium]